jgi:hypothetical protein
MPGATGFTVGSREQIQINGVPVRIYGHFERETVDEAGRTVGEIEIVVIIRGRMLNKQFMQLLVRDDVRLDMDESGQPMTWFARITNHTAVASGSGEATAYRHDITIREVAESWARRAAERASRQAAEPGPAPVRKPVAAPEPGPESISDVLAGVDPGGWGEAIRQLKSAPTSRPTAPPPDPMTPTELAAIEAVLTNLRIDALVDQLEAAGILRKGSVDDRFRHLIDQRFVSEAIPLVGEKVARRALGELVQSA